MPATKSLVNSCSVTDCAYNSGQACHALAITVDDPSPATCGTYMSKQGTHGGATTQIANVGACKAAECSHNENLMCTAGKIEVGMKSGKVSCLTFSPG